MRNVAITNLIFDTIVNLLYQTGYVGVFLLMVMESATLPAPSEIVLPLGGYLVYRGRREFWSVVAVGNLRGRNRARDDFCAPSSLLPSAPPPSCWRLSR